MVRLEAIRAPLFVPGDRPERFSKAAASGADAVILDLEDAVPADSKDEARVRLRTDFTSLPVIIRINPFGTPWHDADVAAAVALQPAALMVPKAREGSHLAGLAARTGLPLLALIETAGGIAEARRIAAMPSVCRLAFGSLDYANDLGCAHERAALLHARSELVLASRLGGLAAPIDGVTAQIGDPEAAREDARHARAVGLGGKLCIHPRQVAVVQEAFAPTQAEIDWAQRVITAGNGATAVDGEMVDPPVRARALAILARAGHMPGRST